MPLCVKLNEITASRADGQICTRYGLTAFRNETEPIVCLHDLSACKEDVLTLIRLLEDERVCVEEFARVLDEFPFSV